MIDRQAQTLLLSIISIVSIFVVAIIVAPIIGKAEERKFQALKFFAKLPQERVKFFINRSMECLRVEEESIAE